MTLYFNTISNRSCPFFVFVWPYVPRLFGNTSGIVARRRKSHCLFIFWNRGHLSLLFSLLPALRLPRNRHYNENHLWNLSYFDTFWNKHLDFFLEKEQFVSRKLTINCNLIDHFTIVHLVVWPLNESYAGVDLVLIDRSLTAFVT